MNIKVRWKEIIYDLDFTPIEVKQYKIGISYSVKLIGINKLKIDNVYDAYGNIITNNRIKELIINKFKEWKDEQK